MPSDPATANTSAIQTGPSPRATPAMTPDCARKPAPTPANAMWPMPSPINDMRFCTRNVPIIGANTPTATPAINARCMKCRSNG